MTFPLPRIRFGKPPGTLSNWKIARAVLVRSQAWLPPRARWPRAGDALPAAHPPATCGARLDPVPIGIATPFREFRIPPGVIERPDRPWKFVDLPEPGA